MHHLPHGEGNEPERNRFHSQRLPFFHEIFQERILLDRFAPSTEIIPKNRVPDEQHVHEHDQDG